MIKKIYLIVLLILALFLSACNSSGDRTSGISSQDANFIEGDGGLKIEFGENTPPSEVLDNGIGIFQIRLLIENLGEHGIDENQAFLKLVGLSSKDFDITDLSKSIPKLFEVRVRGGEQISGGKSFVTFQNLRYKEKLISGSLKIPFEIRACYPYSTKAVTTLCIKEDNNQILDSENAICNPDSTRQAANSAAPVKIENFKQQGIGFGSIQFQFDIVHKPLNNKGSLYKKGSFDSNCNINGKEPTSLDSIEKKNVVKYTISTGLSGIKCGVSQTNTNEVILYDNKHTVFCTQDTTGEETYVKPISLELEYSYLDKIEKSIKIVSTNR